MARYSLFVLKVPLNPKQTKQTNYVRCLMIDFTKTFDTVNHIILLSKLIRLNIPAFIVKWI